MGHGLPLDVPKPSLWNERSEELYLYGELDGSSCVQNCDSDDDRQQLDFYVRWIKANDPEWLAADAVPIYWSVLPIGETAPYQPTFTARVGSPVEDFLSFFSWPVDADSGEPLDWFRLPVRQDRFPELAEAIGWIPSPLQPIAPLQSILNSQRQYYPDRVASRHG